jgi:hypothetical protein
LLYDRRSILDYREIPSSACPGNNSFAE